MKWSKQLEYCDKCPSCQPQTVTITRELALINRTTTSNQSMVVSVKKEMHHHWAISGLAYKIRGIQKNRRSSSRKVSFKVIWWFRSSRKHFQRQKMINHWWLSTLKWCIDLVVGNQPLKLEFYIKFFSSLEVT